MREIKFRAWDKTYSQWKPIETGYLFVRGGCLEYAHVTGSRGDGEVIFMQYTGLKDKNGVEIYEGDIVTTFNVGTSQVRFIDGAFTYGEDYNLFSFHQNHHFGWQDGKSDKVEVIGNIYENPELLK